MPESYSKPCQLSKMMRHIKNPGIFRTVYSGIFRHIKAYSAVSSDVQANIQTCSGVLKDIKAF